MLNRLWTGHSSPSSTHFIPQSAQLSRAHFMSACQSVPIHSPWHPLSCSGASSAALAIRPILSSCSTECLPPQASSHFISPMQFPAPLPQCLSSPRQRRLRRYSRAVSGHAVAATPTPQSSSLLDPEPVFDPQGAEVAAAAVVEAQGFQSRDAALEESIRRDANVQVCDCACARVCKVHARMHVLACMRVCARVYVCLRCVGCACMRSCACMCVCACVWTGI